MWFKLISITPIAIIFLSNQKMIVVPYEITIEFLCACLFDRQAFKSFRV